MNDNKTLDKKRPIQGAHSRQACAACASLAAWADEGPSEARVVPLAPPSRFARRPLHPALRATFSHASARAKGKCEANLARMPFTLPLLRNGPLPLRFAG